MKNLLAYCGSDSTPNNPCVFMTIDDKPPIYLGLYVDDFASFSTSWDREIEFETKLRSLTNVDFMGKVTHFLGIKFSWNREKGEHLSVHLTQEAFAENLIDTVEITDANSVPTPYRLGHPVESIPTPPKSYVAMSSIKQNMQSYVGSLIWLSNTTHPDLATITSILAQRTFNPTPVHL